MNSIGVHASVPYLACEDCTDAVVVPNIVIHEVCANGDEWQAATSTDIVLFRIQLRLDEASRCTIQQGLGVSFARLRIRGSVRVRRMEVTRSGRGEKTTAARRPTVAAGHNFNGQGTAFGSDRAVRSCWANFSAPPGGRVWLPATTSTTKGAATAAPVGG